MYASKKHIVLLGPPAVGKLSVARKLSAMTGFPVFDNAKTVDIARLLFDYGSPKFREYRDRLRYEFYEKAVDTEISGLISTGVLRHPDNWKYFTGIEGIFEAKNWKTFYFLLCAEVSVLLERVESPDRIHKNTLTRRSELEEWLTANTQHSIIDGHSCDVIDTTVRNVKDVTEEIYEIAFEARDIV